MIKYFSHCLFLLIALTSTCDANQFTTNFFSNPELLSASDAIEQLDAKSLDMCWQFGKNDFFHFITKKDEVYFEIYLDAFPSSYDEETQHLFLVKNEISDDQEVEHYIFSCECKAGRHCIINQPRDQEKVSDSNNSNYLVDERRVFKQASPQVISKEGVANIICNNNIIFYTGAGLSIASGVPSMNQLNDLLGLKEGEEFIDSLQQLVKQPETFVENVTQFHNAPYRRNRLLSMETKNNTHELNLLT